MQRQLSQCLNNLDDVVVVLGGAVEERKLDSARPVMVSARGALPVVLAQRRGGRERFIRGYRVRRRGGAAGDSVLYCRLGYKWLARLADS